MRVAIAGFLHETNTFAPFKTGYEKFLVAGARPALTRGEDVLTVFPASNIPIGGFINAAEEKKWSLAPVLWCHSPPAGHVTDQAFETVSAMIVQGLQDLLPYDAIYLDLHGAMVTESYEDGEGELLRRIRAVFGPEIPLVVSLDFHANVTEAMVHNSDVLAIFRTYPHLDMAATGARAANLLERLTREGKPAKALRKASFLIPLHAQYSEMTPNKSLYAMLSDGEGDIWNSDLAEGFPPADIFDSGPSVVVYGSNAESTAQEADRLIAAVDAAEPEFDTTLLSPQEAMAKAALVEPGKPVIFADVQDNPGGGGTSDTTGLLQAFVEAGAQKVLLGLLHDPDVAATAHEVGVGKVFSAELGGKLGGPGDGCFGGKFCVEALSDGSFDFTGEIYGGITAELGPMALLRVMERECDVQVLVGSRRCQCLDLAIFRHIGADPLAFSIVAVKSTVHFRADFEPISAAVMLVHSVGSHPCQLEDVSYKNLRNNVRLGPCGRPHSGPSRRN